MTPGECQLGNAVQIPWPFIWGPFVGNLSGFNSPPAPYSSTLLPCTHAAVFHTSVSWLVLPLLLLFLGRGSCLKAQLRYAPLEQLSPELPAKPVSLTPCRWPWDRRL